MQKSQYEGIISNDWLQKAGTLRQQLFLAECNSNLEFPTTIGVLSHYHAFSFITAYKTDLFIYLFICIRHIHKSTVHSNMNKRK